jgi:hypothetical protein
MGNNRAGANLRKRRKRHVKNLKTQWAAEDKAAAAAAAPKAKVKKTKAKE